MSSCLSGGGRTYGFELELIKSQSSSSNQTTIQTTTSSSSSTLSESSNSPLSISTRKPRTPRKRPNQIYNEAAALLSTAYPNIFSRKHFTQNPGKFTKPRDSSFYNDQSDELLLPFRLIDDFGTPLHCHHHHSSSIQEKTRFQFEHKMSVDISSPDTNSLSLCNDDNGDNGDIDDDDEDLNGESSTTILDEEIEEGIIDSIMGNLCVNESYSPSSCHQDISINASYGYPMPIGLGFGGVFGLHRGLRKALKPVDDGDWWRFPAVDVDQISPKYNTTTTTTTATNNNKVINVVASKKKKKKIEKTIEEIEKSNSNVNSNSNANSELSEEKGIEGNTNSGLLLKLNFDDVLTSWSDRGSPFSDDIQASELAGADLHARLAQIDLFLENGGVREASVMRYKEKRRTRLFSKKIRYQVRKVNADTRPRMKGRFVRRLNSNASGALK